MGKVSGSYESVIRGVSEQVIQDRRSGQHHEQINMISDPVRGLARRPGSVLKSETVMGDCADLAYYDKLMASTAYTRDFTFSVAGVEYDLIYRSNADTESLGQTAFAFCFNRSTGQSIPIAYKSGDTTLNTLISGGVSAIVNVGRFIYIAGKTIVPTYSTTQKYSASSNKQKMAVWVRGGAYSRTFSITLMRANGTSTTVSYKTVSASYPTLLDTSDLLTSDPDYQKKVNDRVYAYNSEVTKWIGTAAEDITPENIAAKLRAALVAAGVTGTSVQDSTVMISNTNYVEVKADDNGDNTLIRPVGNELLSADLLSTVHWVGKVVKVRPKRSDGSDAIYMEAFAKDNVSTGITEVSWREGAGIVTTPLRVFVMGTVEGGTLHLASNPADLATMAGITVPGYSPSSVGDDITSPLPSLFGNRVDYLGNFQDRLVIGTGVVLLMSKPGEYLNWFRTSVLTQPDDDPVELFSLGSEDDTIRSSTTYDRNLILHGGKKHYVINGRIPVTPKTASVVALAAHEDTQDAPPRAMGDFVFFARVSGPTGNRTTTMHQLMAGQLEDTPAAADISQQLSKYLSGTPSQILPLSSPKMVMLRTTATRYGISTYSYMDAQGGSERLFDSWSKWTWDESLGGIVGMTRSFDGAGIYVYMIRQGLNAAGVRKWWIACEQFNMTTELSARPYADSLRLQPTLVGATSFLNENNLPESGCIAFGFESERPLIGAPLSGKATFQSQHADYAEAYVGVNYPAFVTPTNPFIRDRQDRAIMVGRTTMTSVKIAVADTAACTVEVTTKAGTKPSLEFTGRILGQSTNTIGHQPVVTTTLSAPVGKEVRDCTYTLRAKNWLPLTVSALGWTGQHFNNVRVV